jgi:eukaryotic-like serine/threonine-protein kinase
VVSIYAVEDEPTPYLVMEYIPGRTLEQRLNEHGPLELLDVLRLGKQIADGLAAAHTQGLIHRDVKPGNILLETSVDDHVKITDFGLARTADDATMTQSGVIAGTPMYMAPEQAHGHKLDQRADLFSFGSVL